MSAYIPPKKQQFIMAEDQAFADPFLGFEKAREYLGYPAPSTMREWTSKRRITSYKPGKTVMYRLSDLDKFMAQNCKLSVDALAENLEQKKREYEA